MEKLNIIKIGGNVIDDEAQLLLFLQDVATIPGNKILVHGGGKLATELSGQLGIQTQLVDGRRITDAATLKVVTMVYAGWINKTVSARLNASGCPAIGLSGSDAALVPSVKREVGEIDYGFVGDVIVDEINTDFLQKIINQGFCPVVAPITADKSGQLLNTNADTIASSLAVALSLYYEVTLLYCFEKRGVLMDVKDEESFISQLEINKYQHLKQEGIIAKGMIPKLDNAFEAVNKGVKKVWIGHHRDLINFIHGHHAGTSITGSPQFIK